LRDLPRRRAVHARRFDLLVGADASRTSSSRTCARTGSFISPVHGYFDSGVRFSGIVLSGTGASWRASTISSACSARRRRVFLSACESTRGGFEVSEGRRAPCSLLLSVRAR
jgi:hypothetical protein